MSVATFTLIAGSHLAQLADIGRPLPASPCCVAPCLLPSSPRRAAGAHLRVRADTPRHAATRRNQVPATASRPRHTAQIVHSTPAHPAREAPPDTNPSEGSMAPSKLGRRIKFALALLTALATSGAIRAHARTVTVLPCSYPFKSTDPRTYVAFNESEVLRAFSPQGTINALPGLTIKVWYNDEHALTLGVRRVIVKTSTGITTTDYPFSALTQNPAGVLNPQVGTTVLDGDQAGTDTSACSGYPDLCDRPMFPALFITDITTNPTSTAGDWQHGGTPIPPHAVFGTWKGAVRTVNKTRSPALITVLPDANPARNYWNLGSGDPAPLGLTNQGWGAEVRWNVDDLVAAGKMILGHAYRLQFMVHDGDQTRTGGDSGENCVNIKPNCADATACDDRNPCTADYCVLGSCGHAPIAGCKLCTTAADCDDGNACTTPAQADGTPCTDGYACTQTDICAAGVCVGTNPVVCTASDQCHTAGACNPATGTCSNPTKVDGTPCTDGNACTQTDTCAAGSCVGTNPVVCTASDQCHTAGTCDPATGTCSNPPIAGCKFCSTATDCDDQNACTYDTCVSGVCSNAPIAGCTLCATVADCAAPNACQPARCSSGACNTSTIQACARCTTSTAATDCDDQNACTTDSCVSGVCSHQTIRPCKPCTSPGTCNDQNPCTTDTCDAPGVCHNTPIAGCVNCTSSAFCNDNNACTTDSCTGGVCVHTYVYNTTTCLGPDASSPEICGNCIDDDGNGLTDFEDPACCLESSTFTMKLKEGRLHPHGATTRLALRTVLARSGLAVNPLDDDVVLQIRPEGGTDVFCARIPAADFTKRRRRRPSRPPGGSGGRRRRRRSEEHTSELQSPDHLVCR